MAAPAPVVAAAITLPEAYAKVVDARLIQIGVISVRLGKETTFLRMLEYLQKVEASCLIPNVLDYMHKAEQKIAMGLKPENFSKEKSNYKIVSRIDNPSVCFLLVSARFAQISLVCGSSLEVEQAHELTRKIAEYDELFSKITHMSQERGLLQVEVSNPGISKEEKSKLTVKLEKFDREVMANRLLHHAANVPQLKMQLEHTINVTIKGNKHQRYNLQLDCLDEVCRSKRLTGSEVHFLLNDISLKYYTDLENPMVRFVD